MFNIQPCWIDVVVRIWKQKQRGPFQILSPNWMICESFENLNLLLVNQATVGSLKVDWHAISNVFCVSTSVIKVTTSYASTQNWTMHAHSIEQIISIIYQKIERDLTLNKIVFTLSKFIRWCSSMMSWIILLHINCSWISGMIENSMGFSYFWNEKEHGFVCKTIESKHKVTNTCDAWVMKKYKNCLQLRKKVKI